MRASQFHLFTLKEAPSDAEVVSQKLMLRAGMIRKTAAGIYSYLPMGLRAIRKVENIVREEMNQAGAVELLMPLVQPAELWQETGRWDKMGPELLRFKDGHEIAMLSTIGGAIGVTHGIYGKGWFKSMIHRQPIIAFSVTIAAIGVCMPLVIVPLRRKLGMPTNQYDHADPKTVWPKIIE